MIDETKRLEKDDIELNPNYDPKYKLVQKSLNNISDINYHNQINDEKSKNKIVEKIPL